MNSLLSTTSLNQITADLFASKALFREVVNCDLWDTCLSDSKKQDLLDKYLPQCLTNEEKEDTVKQLLSGNLKRFDDNPMDTIYFHLKIQRLSPDLIKVMDEVKQLKLKSQKQQEQENQCKLFFDVINKRKTLFEDAINSPLDCVIRNVKYPRGSFLDTNCPKSHRKRLLLRCQKAKERYKKELKEIKDSVFENEDEKSKSSTDDEDIFAVLNDDKLHNAEALPFSTNVSLSSPNIFSIPEPNYIRMLKKHKHKRKRLEEAKLEDNRFNTSNISLNGIIRRVTNASEEEKDMAVVNSNCDAKLSSPSVKASKTPPNGNVQIVKKKNRAHLLNKVISTTVPVCETEKKVDSEVSVKKEPMDVFDFDNDSPPQSFPPPPLTLPSSAVTTTAPISTLSSIINQPQSPIIAAPLPALPPLLPSTPDPPPPPPMPLEKPPKCFFSLLRDTFYTHSPNDFKLTLHKLEELIKEKLRCYDPKIGWSHEMVQSAMNYLSGVLPPPEMVPLVDYKEKNQQWQWIGIERDNDDVLFSLCKEWTEEKDKNSSTSLMDPSQPIPPPICPTDWIVKPSNEEEKKIYREQEALRYNNPHKAFTFRIHGYESVVGPVKGCGIGGINSHTSSPNKAREHSLLVSDRPPFVTLLSLVRDAAARLPNGEGTRADICELLKDSQYLLPTVSDQQVNGIVSGALDRLHYEKDPCVKYDVNRKVWIYLHRNRSEQEFERLHEVQVAAAKAKRSLNKTQRRTSSTSSVPKIPSSFVGKQASKIQKIGPVTPITISDQSNSLSSSNPIQVASSLSPVITSTVVNTSVSSPQLFSSPTISAVTSYSNVGLNLSSNVTVTTDTLQMTKPKLASVLPIVSKKKIQKAKVIKKPGEEKEEESSPTFTAVIPTTVSISNIQTVSSMPSIAVTALPLTSFAKIESVEASTVTSGITSIVTTKSVTNKLKSVRPTKPLQKPQITLSQRTDLQTTTESNLQHILSIASSALPKSTQIAIPAGAKISVPKQSFQQASQVQQIQQQISVPKQIQLQNQVVSSTSGTATGTHQISIPTSVLFGARPGSVVLGNVVICDFQVLIYILIVNAATPTGKSYMMAAAGGQIVLQPQGPTASPITTAVTSTTGSQPTASLAVRTLQGIRVIPVTSGVAAPKNATPILAQSHLSGSQSQGTSTINPQHHVVARIITTGQPGRGGVPQTQIVIPSTSAFQPLLLAQANQVTTASTPQTITTSIQVNPAPIFTQASQVSLPIQHQIKTIELPSQKQTSK
ncbi:nuclear factor related to kappa-B-binding protein-like protein [Dinothrombium tinctorium]|uniref:Nuclear factor related to kappa-B-binding protein-like protein n=1 Tax=Dinothrombium tinctorium TaxID=1965070 RepID=A0A443QR68_9ACAR|nr:nuclear factor related to kappa-B-binding protein-like protein [Dinothrombium tinctorium]